MNLTDLCVFLERARSKAMTDRIRKVKMRNRVSYWIIFLDLRKAFDSVSRPRLIDKLV